MTTCSSILLPCGKRFFRIASTTFPKCSAALPHRFRAVCHFGARTRHVFALLLLWAVAFAAGAQALETAPPAGALTVWNREIYVFRVPMFELSPEQRASRAAQRIAALPAERLNSAVEVLALEHQGVQGYAVTIEGETLFSVFPGDSEPGDPPLPQVAAHAAEALHRALQAREAQSSGRQIVLAVAWAALATLMLATVAWALQRIARWIEFRTRTLHASVASRSLFDWRRMLVSALVAMIRWIKAALMLFAGYLWLAFTLTRFPYTHPWGEKLGDSLLLLLSRLVVGVLHALPDLATVAAIFLLARLAVRGLHALFDAAHATGARFSALQADTIGATRRLTAALIWLFAVVVAYPFIPGSNSDAFKGLSVFFGVLVTLGSSGLVSQVMAGLVLIYTRALRPGDFVQIGESEGYVVDLGALSTKLRNRLDQEVTVPNSVVVATRIINHSHTSKAPGVSLSTSVTIGYDSAWRQIEAMLLMAAARTPALLPQPAPVVRQIQLQDFYVQYELNVFMRAGAPKYDIMNTLHGHIQDVFNEYGVQIMSPHFVLQPAASVVIPKEEWRPPPAD
jgi:small-conductance mechanosensitive channel